MAVFYNTDELKSFNNAVITIGTFDGVHLGHLTILQQVVAHAKELGGESIGAPADEEADNHMRDTRTQQQADSQRERCRARLEEQHQRYRHGDTNRGVGILRQGPALASAVQPHGQCNDARF